MPANENNNTTELITKGDKPMFSIGIPILRLIKESINIMENIAISIIKKEISFFFIIISALDI
jgi:hypothetical protein